MTKWVEKEIMSVIPGLAREPKSWQERKAGIAHVWDKPFVWFDCRFEWFFYRSRQRAFNQSLSLLVQSHRN